MVTKSADHQTFYANGVGFAVSDNDVRLMFGITDTAEGEEMTEQVGIYVTHRTLKVLAATAAEIVAHIERTSGSVIPLDAARIENLKGLLGNTATSPTASPPPPSQSPPGAPAS